MPSEESHTQGFLLETLNNLVTAIRETRPEPVAPRNEHLGGVTYEKFLKLDPPVFIGRADPSSRRVGSKRQNVPSRYWEYQKRKRPTLARIG